MNSSLRHLIVSLAFAFAATAGVATAQTGSIDPNTVQVREITQQATLESPTESLTDTEGNIFVVTQTRRGNVNNRSEIFLRKYSPAGALLWTRTRTISTQSNPTQYLQSWGDGSTQPLTAVEYNYGNDLIEPDIAVDSNGGVALAVDIIKRGTSSTGSQTTIRQREILVTKFNANGAWVGQIFATHTEASLRPASNLLSFQTLPNGEFVALIASVESDGSTANVKTLVRRFSNDCTTSFFLSVHGTDGDAQRFGSAFLPIDLTFDATGNIYFAARTSGSNVVRKLNSSGATIGENVTTGGTGGDQMGVELNVANGVGRRSIQVDGLGVYIGGMTAPEAAGSTLRKPVVRKLDTALAAELWRAVVPQSSVIFQGIDVDAAGVTIAARSNKAAGAINLVSRLALSGEVIWTKESPLGTMQMIANRPGDVFLVGGPASGAGTTHYAKFARNGDFQFVKEIRGTNQLANTVLQGATPLFFTVTGLPAFSDVYSSSTSNIVVTLELGNPANVYTSTPPPTPEPRRLWVAGGDLYDNETDGVADDTSATNETVPQWSYGFRAAVAGSSFTPFIPAQHTDASNGKVAGASASQHLQGWEADAALVVNTTNQDISLSYGPGTLRPLVIGQMLLNPSAGAVPVARWTAPATGRYNIVARWLDLDGRGGNGASAHVLVNGQERFAQEFEDTGGANMNAREFDLSANDVVDFVVGSRGDVQFDATAFNAAIAIAPKITLSGPGSAVDGETLSYTANVEHAYEIRDVALYASGELIGRDSTAPYEISYPNVEAGRYQIEAVVTDDEGVETLSSPISLFVSRSSAATRNASSKDSAQRAKAAESGIDYIFIKESGVWSDPANWAPQGVPGPQDSANIGAVIVTLTEPAAVAQLFVGADGTIVGSAAEVTLTVNKLAEIDGTVGAFTLIIPAGGKLTSFIQEGTFNSMQLIIEGKMLVTGTGGIKGTGTTLTSSGVFSLLQPPGRDRIVDLDVNKAHFTGGHATIDSNTRLNVNELVAAGGLNLNGNGAGKLVGNAGGTLIGADGATVAGKPGATLIGADGASLIGADGATLIGADGATLVGNAGGTLVGNAGGTFQPTRAALSSKGGSQSASAAGFNSTLILDGGTLTGTGNILMNLLNRRGFIVPGSSPGAFEIAGDFIQENAGTLVLEAGGTQLAQYDQLRIAGTANLGGNLIAKTIDGYTPQSGDSLTPLTYSSVSGQFASVTSNAQVSLGANGMTMQVSGPNPPAPKALNIATRMRVETGDNVLIAGFIITGSQPKKVLVRGIGPSLPVSGALADPTLDLDAGAFFNDDWRTDQQGEIEATTIPPSSDVESAIVATLEPGAHTAVLRGKNDGTGVGLVEVYDLESGTPVQLANISTRGQVQTGDNVMIGGFIIGGTYPAKVLIRAIGPSLPVNGALQDPTLELVDGNGATISNDNWRSTQESEIIGTTVPPTNDREAAIVATLVPGAYTAIVRGKDDTTGVALVEGYNLE